MSENLLLYYDILGFRQLMKTLSEAQLRQTVHLAIEEAALLLAPGSRFDMLNYSDTVLVWSRIEGRDHACHMRLWALACNVFLNLMARRIPIRAAIVCGRFVPSPTAASIDEIQSEPALQEAHQYAEKHMSLVSLMGIVVAPSLSRRWCDESLAPLLANGSVSERQANGEFYLNPFVSLTSRFRNWVTDDSGYSDLEDRLRQADEQALRALAFLLDTRDRMKRDLTPDAGVIEKYEKTLEFACSCLGKPCFDEACLQAHALPA